MKDEGVMMREWERIRGLIPEPDGEIRWEEWGKTALGSYFEKMKKTPQNPAWHGEGDVFTHTSMVLCALLADEEYQGLDRKRREMLFVAALLHDMGKTVCTVKEDGVWRSPKHTVVGARMAREFLWTKWGLCGSYEAQSLRESIAALIRYHGTPVYLSERADPERKLIEMAAVGERVSDFSLALLRILVRADLSGRIAKDKEKKLEDAEFAFFPAEEMGIMQSPYVFPDEITKHAYLRGKSMARDFFLYDNTWREVILVAGLPGTGKDTWIHENYSHLPMISLDDIRREMKISPADPEGQGRVIECAKVRARELLRKKISFVWNATNVTPEMRRKQIDLFEKYDAYTHIVFLETDLETEYERNRGRADAVPSSVIDRLLSKTEPPMSWEAHRVEWIMT